MSTVAKFHSTRFEWESKQMYKHDRAELCGKVAKYHNGGYVLVVGNNTCPVNQGWASKIHYTENLQKMES